MPQNFEGFLFHPSSEQEVVGLFVKLLPKLDISLNIEELRTEFPDCLAWKLTEEGVEKLKIEFELFSQNFLEHGHKVEGCDLIVCWEDNWSSCPIDVLELKSEIEKIDEKFIYFDKPKYSTKTWTAEKFLDRVKDQHGNLSDIHEEILTELTNRKVNILAGKGSKEATYSFYIPFTNNKARMGINADGTVTIEFKDTPERLKERLAAGFLYKFGVDFNPQLSWTKVCKLGQDISKNEVSSFLELILEESTELSK